jgi:hypothetical protein
MSQQVCISVVFRLDYALSTCVRHVFIEGVGSQFLLILVPAFDSICQIMCLAVHFFGGFLGACFGPPLFCVGNLAQAIGCGKCLRR